MVSMTDLAAIHGSEASIKRRKSRRAAELRLRIYGIIAISLAALALVALLWSVVGKATGAIYEHYLVFETPLEAAAIDPNGTGDPDVIRKADYTGMTRNLIRSNFDYVTDRRTKRQLNDLISVGAATELRDMVRDDPSLVGQSPKVEYLASDVVDLYLKGYFGRLREADSSGALTVVDAGKTVEITSSSNDFTAILAAVKQQMGREARRIENRITLEQNGITEFERRLGLGVAEDKERIEGEIATRTAKRNQIQAELDELLARAGTADAAEKLKVSDVSGLIRVGEGWIKLTEVGPSSAKGTVLKPIGETTEFAPDDWRLMVNDAPENSRKVSDNQIVWAETLRENGQVVRKLNTRFLSSGDSREPELAGLWGATVGSFWTMVVTFFLAFPIGVCAAIYLEEFAPKNRITDLIEVNINNLAAVPSIIFGLLGLAVFLGFFGVPRSAPLAGGIVLALMTLPTIIIASRAAIRAVPPSIRDAALGLGASKLQTSFHHVLPLAMPGILTGTIIGMAQALGETAPLIMIGMVAFIVDIPTGITDSASALPVQIFRWADFPERAFEAKTAAAIVVLLLFLIVMNAIAVFLRKQFERRW